MATDNPTTGKSEPDRFDALDHRLLSLISRLQCVVKNFGEDYDGLALDLHPAAFVLEETVEDVIEFRGDLESWHMDHEHTPKAPKEVQS